MHRGWRAAPLTASLLWGCGPSGPEGWPAGQPLIEQLAYIGQRPQAPEQLVFAVFFTDTDGDLAEGFVDLSLDGERRSRQPMTEVFETQRPPLPRTSTRGRLELYVDVQADLAEGARFRVGFRLEDGRGQASNEPSVVLEVVGPVASSGGGGT